MTGIYVILEKAWAGVDDFYPQLAVDKYGKILKFSTQEKAERKSYECILRSLGQS